MDEIDAAVEDAEYVRAMRDGVPQPTKGWDYMSGAELEKYLDQLRKVTGNGLSLDSITANNLGFYHFTKYLRENGAIPEANFMIAVASFRLQAESDQRTLGTTIAKSFLQDTATGDDANCPSVLGLSRKIPRDSLRPRAPVECKAGGSNALRVSGDYVNQVGGLFGERRRSLSPLKSSSRKIGEGLTISPSVFDPIEEVVFNTLKATHGEGFAQSQDCHRYHQFMAMLSQVQKHGLEENNDFFVLRVVGRGGFGLVNACKKATTGKLYAMKQMSKNRIKLKRCEELIVAERDTLSQVQSPYVVNLLYAFHNTTDVFLILDLMIGGDLNFHLRTKGRFSLRETKYYVARTVLGIAALHDFNYAHRDLKPENILMDVQGRTRISDFGLVGKVPPEGLTKTCGTRGYWAPEMIARPRTPYFLAVDWFSLGVCMFELLTGENPFQLLAEESLQDSPEWDRSQFEAAVDLAILQSDPDLSLIIPSPPPSVDAGQKPHTEGGGAGAPDGRRSSAVVPAGRPSFTALALTVSPTALSRRMSGAQAAAVAARAASPSLLQAKDLLRRLLARDPTQRIGWGGYQEIMQHEWFADICWGALNTMTPPWCPETEINMKAQSEMGEFSDEKESKQVKLDEADQAYYKGWNFVSETGFQDEIVEFLLYEELKGPIRPPAESSCCVMC